jgi:hypothetical protein
MTRRAQVAAALSAHSSSLDGYVATAAALATLD